MRKIFLGFLNLIAATNESVNLIPDDISLGNVEEFLKSNLNLNSKPKKSKGKLSFEKNEEELNTVQSCDNEGINGENLLSSEDIKCNPIDNSENSISNSGSSIEGNPSRNGGNSIDNLTKVNPIDNVTQINPIDNSTQVNPNVNVTQVNPVDNSTQINPVDNSTQVNPIDNSTQVNPIDNSIQVNPIDNPIENSNNDNSVYTILKGYPIENTNKPFINKNRPLLSKFRENQLRIKKLLIKKEVYSTNNLPYSAFSSVKIKSIEIENNPTKNFFFKESDFTIKATSDLPPRSEQQFIPKIFHTIWFDFGNGNEVLPKYQENVKNLMDLHPQWEVKLWKENDVLTLIEDNFPEFLEVFEGYDQPIKKHDSSRIIILYLMGGVYLDQDFIALRNIESLLKSYEFVVGNEDKDAFTPVNGFIASTKRHPLLKEMIREMNNPELARKHVFDATGPTLLKKVIEDYCQRFGNIGIKVYSKEFFYPVNSKDKALLKDLKKSALPIIFPNSYLVQEYDGNWQ